MDDVLTIYDRAVGAIAQFDRKGKTLPYTSANGYMFSFINKADELGIRISPVAGKAFDEKHGTGPFMSHGSKMREYISIPNEMMADEKQIRELLYEGYNYVMSLPPK